MRFLNCPVLVGLVLALMLSGQAAITYPQVAVGGGYETVIAITNPTNQTWTGQLSFKAGTGAEFPVALKANGQPIGPTSNWTIEPQGTARQVVTADAEATSGYLEISTQSGPAEDELVTAVFFRLRDSSGAPVDLVGTHSAKPLRKAVFPIDRSPAVDTGIAILVSEQTGDPVVFTLRDLSGLNVQEVPLARTGHVAMMASDLFDQLPATFLGSVTVESPQPVRLLVLRLEISQGVVQLSGTAPLPLAATRSAVDRLEFEPIAAQYASSLDVIVAVASNPDRVHLYDPEAKTADSIDLGAPPLGLSVSPDGHFAAVRHNGSISYLDLVNKRVEKVISVPSDVTEVVLAGNGYAYLFPRTWEVLSLKISDGQITSSPFYNAPSSSFGRLHPDGHSLYLVDDEYGSHMYKFEIHDGVATYAYQSSSTDSYQTEYGHFEFSEDGKRVITTGGPVIRASEVRSQDMQANGTLEWFVVNVGQSGEAGRIAVITQTESLFPESLGAELWIYDYETLQRRETASLPLFAPETAVQSYGRYLFYNSAGTKLFVVVEADPGAEVSGNRHGVVVYDVAGLEGE